MRKWLLAAVLYGLLTPIAVAVEPFTVDDIRVEGLQRISLGSVLNRMEFEAGETLEADDAAAVVRNLFATGFFHDVILSRDGDTLVVDVRERPSIGELTIEGNQDIGTDELSDSLESIGLAEGRIFNRSVLERVEQELRRQYYSNGKYGVTIETTVEPLPRNRVAVRVDIHEGDVARIRQLNLVGNRAFETDELLDNFELGPRRPLALFSSRDSYSQQRLTGDLETLRSHYLDRGYVDFQITSSQVSITPEKDDVYVTVNVSEGNQFTVSEVTLDARRFPVEREELEGMVEIEPGEIFSRSRVTRAAERISERLAREGYAFADVNPVPSFDREAREVALRFDIEPGNRVYVRRIEISGNNKTRDEVIRREMRQLEGALLLPERVNLSRQRLNRLGFFEQVNVDTRPVPGTDDQVDLEVRVVEMPSGSLSAGIGYSESQGMLVNASVTQRNFLGTGTRNSLTINNSEQSEVYELSYTDPYHTRSGISRSLRANYRSTDTDGGRAFVTRFVTDSYGAGVNYGFPMGERETLRFGVDYEHTHLKTTGGSPNEVDDYIDTYGDRYGNWELSTGWTYDSRDRGLFPRSGGRLKTSLSTTGPGSDLEYYRVSLDPQYYIPLGERATFSLSSRIGYGDGYGDTDELPIFERYYSGGTNSVRGFRANSLGPRDQENDRALGGSFVTNASLELMFPPGDGESMRVGFFIDGGNVFADIDDFDGDEIRASYGAGLNWLTPVGLLQLSYAQPLIAEDDDELETVQFNIGMPF
ncbi:MAG: outer membrane protein assembly factor BamA [Pseudomonadota bacterium]